MDDLYKIGVGIVGISAPFFYCLEPREVLLAIEGHEIHKREQFYLQQTAVTNAIGLNFTKGYKVIDPFNNESKKQKTVTHEEKQETLSFLKQKFN